MPFLVAFYLLFMSHRINDVLDLYYVNDSLADLCYNVSAQMILSPYLRHTLMVVFLTTGFALGLRLSPY